MALQEQNKDILLVLRDIQIGMQHIQANGGGNRSTAGVPVAGTTGLTPTAAIRDLQDRIAAGNTKLLPPGKPTILPPFNGGSLKEKTSSNYGFYLMILGYVALSYIFNKNWRALNKLCEWLIKSQIIVYMYNPLLCCYYVLLHYDCSCFSNPKDLLVNAQE